MGRGYVVGLLAGALFSSVSVAALSLVVSPAGKGAPDQPQIAETPVEQAPETAEPETVAEAPKPEPAPAAEAPAPAPEAAKTPEPSEPPAEVASAEPAETAVAPEPQAKSAPEPDATAEAAPAPATPEPAPQPAPAAQAALTPQPETPVVDVPAGSEFNRPKPEVEPVVPATQPAPAASVAPAVTAPAADASPAMTEQSPATVPQGQAEAPEAPPVADVPDAVAEAPAGEGVLPVPPPGEAVLPDLAPAEPDAAVPAPDETAQAEPPAKPTTSRLPQIITPAAEPAPDATAEAAPEPAPEPSTEPETVIVPPGGAIARASNKPRILTPGTGRTTEDGPVIIDVAPSPPVGAAPQVGFGQKAPGVQVNRLPRIGDAAPAPEASAPDAGTADAAPDTAVTRFRANFDNAEQKPVIAIVLVDDGSSSAADPDSIGQIGAPVTIALNPEVTGVSVLAQTHRLAGDEVAILAPKLPKGATPSDLEVSYQAYIQTLPESVALVALPDSAVQSDSMVAKHMAALLGAEGRGLVTSERGLNPARQAAERAGVPYAGITKMLEEGGQDAAAIGRLLDRAAFDASRGSRIVIMGRSTPEAVAAIRSWNEAGGHEAIVGPLSAVLAP